MGRIRNSPKKDPLTKRASGGGVLSAAEKRQRMLDAGKRFVMKSVHSLSPARIGSKMNKHTANLKKSFLKKENGYVSKLLGNPNSSDSVKSIRTLLQPSSSVSRQLNREKCGYQSYDEEMFRKDENSLSEILNHRPISRSVGRPSQLRQNRPSFFPNGVNPVDKPQSDSIPPKKPPRTFKELHIENVMTQTRTALSCTESASCSLISTPLKKTPGKSVRFAENVHESHVKLLINNSKWTFLNDLMQFINGADNSDLDEFFSAFPQQTFIRLQESIARFSDKCLLNSGMRGQSHKLVTLKKIAEEKVSVPNDSEDLSGWKELAESCSGENLPVTGIVVEMAKFLDKTKKDDRGNLGERTAVSKFSKLDEKEMKNEIVCFETPVKHTYNLRNSPAKLLMS